MLRRTVQLLVWLLLLAFPTVTAAGEPMPGHDDWYPHDPGDPRRVLDFHFFAADPAWFKADVEVELETNWDNTTANNSNVPQYSDGEDNVGGGTIDYIDDPTSPCTGSTVWAGCNPQSGLVAFQIFVRLIPSASAPTWLWWERDSTCTDLYDGNPNPNDGFATSVCFSMNRAVAHESEHNTLSRLHYAGTESETIMQSTLFTPNSSPTYWNRSNFLKCDLAGAQLEYGLANPAGKYADCFATVPGHGVKGLNTKITITSGTSYTVCFTSPQTVRGRLALDNLAAYEDMANTPLQGRTVRIDRKPSTSSSWTNGAFTTLATGAAGDNWSRQLTTSVAGLWNYRASFQTIAAETGINTSNTVTWNINWVSIGCPQAPAP